MIKAVIVQSIISIIIVTYSIYMVFLRAPSAVAARPELQEIGWWTALFSGRFFDWLYFHFPIAGTIITLVIVNVITFVYYLIEIQ